MRPAPEAPEGVRVGRDAPAECRCGPRADRTGSPGDDLAPSLRRRLARRPRTRPLASRPAGSWRRSAGRPACWMRRASRPRSSPRCPRWPRAPARSTSARASRTPTARRRCSRPPSRAIRGGRNQYPPGPGIPELRTAIAAHQRRFYGLDFDPDTEVLVTAGATEAIAAAVLALCEPGDEVGRRSSRTTTPTPPCIALAGAVRRPVPLRVAATSRSTPTSCAAAVTAADPAAAAQHARTTRPARCSPRDELAAIAALASSTTSSVVTDEVYEHLRLRRRRARPARHPARHARAHAHDLVGRQDVLVHRLEDRLGARRPSRSSTAVRTAKQFLTYVNGAPFQPAVAAGARAADDVVRRARADAAGRRDLLSERCCRGAVRRAGRAARTSSSPTSRLLGYDDRTARAGTCRRTRGVVAVPVRLTTTHLRPGRQLVRFALCKRRRSSPRPPGACGRSRRYRVVHKRASVATRSTASQAPAAGGRCWRGCRRCACWPDPRRRSPSRWA